MPLRSGSCWPSLAGSEPAGWAPAACSLAFTLPTSCKTFFNMPARRQLQLRVGCSSLGPAGLWVGRIAPIVKAGAHMRIAALSIEGKRGAATHFTGPDEGRAGLLRASAHCSHVWGDLNFAYSCQLGPPEARWTWWTWWTKNQGSRATMAMLMQPGSFSWWSRSWRR